MQTVPILETPLRRDDLDPLPYTAEWPSLRSRFGRVDIHSLAAFWTQESQVAGPYLEFGVGAGRSAVAAVRAHRIYGYDPDRDFFLFDSYAGLPALNGRDADSRQFHQGQFAFSKQDVIGTLMAHQAYDPRAVHLVEGWFEESLSRFQLETFGYRHAAIVHVDVDLHESCETVLQWVTPYLQTGTFMLFDDWNAFCASDRAGERAAAAEWLQRRRHIKLHDYAAYGWHGKAFIVQVDEVESST